MIRTKWLCPFEPGDVVVYRPSERGLAADVMTPESQKLIPGKKYVVKDVMEGRYVLVEGDSLGGLFWTEFEGTGCKSPQS
jgi:hypothetical protein